VSSVRITLWDIAGKIQGIPIYKLIGGGYRTRIHAYASGVWSLLEQAGEEVTSYIAKGFNAMKMRVCGIDEPNPAEGVRPLAQTWTS
jgi:L-alanine-DL-glutamate epimerase-like enolase superfamily enzyme